MASKQALENNDILRTERLQSCEIALVEGIAKNSESVLRWFTSEILRFPWAWRSVVTMALLDKTKAGEYRWRKAKNPLGIVRTIARRAALKWNPELLFGNDTDKVLRPYERAVSTLRGPCDGGTTGTYVDAEDETSGGGYWHDEFIDRADFESAHDYRPEVWDQMDYSLTSTEKDGLSFDWTEIGRRIGLTSDQTKMMKERAKGITRAEIGQRLSWNEQKVERTWRALSRYFEKPGMGEKIHAKLAPPGKKTLPRLSPKPKNATRLE